jgi:hypothetical protein
MEPATITRGLLLFVLSYINITLIAAVLFVLCRTLVKAWLERRRGNLGSRFQTKLLVTYLGLTAIPIGLLFFTATGLLQRSIDRWFSTPVREVVGRARAVEDMAEKRVVDDTLEKARALAGAAIPPGEVARLEEFRGRQGLDSAEAYRGSLRLGLAAKTPAVDPARTATASSSGPGTWSGPRGPASARSRRGPWTRSRRPGANTRSSRRRSPR